MKKILKSLCLALTILSASAYAASNPHFTLHANGKTILCPSAAVGESGTVGSTTYTKIDEKTDLLIYPTKGTVDATKACTSGVTTMEQWFSSKVLFNKDISHWDTSSVTSMYTMFFLAEKFNQDIGNWDTSSVADMRSMFNNAYAFNKDISTWCVSGIKNKPSGFDNTSGFSGQSALQPKWGTCAEPTNQPTAFTATANSTSQITTAWTDSATGSQAPTSYLVLCSSTSDTFTNPKDAIAQSDDTNCTDGTGVQNIAKGTGTVAWTGLSEGTKYYYKIFPYTGTGINVDYKVDGTVVKANATTTAPTSTGGSTPTPEPTPTQLVESFVKRLYEHILSRLAEQSGVDYWTTDLTTGGLSAYEVVLNFFQSTEYLSRETSNGGFVGDVYKSILDRKVDPAGYHYWVTQLSKGLTRDQLLDALLRSKEFKKLSADYGVKTFPDS